MEDKIALIITLRSMKSATVLISVYLNSVSRATETIQLPQG